jgi:hypothetical protein
MSDVMARHCGSVAVAKLLSHQLRDSAWGTVWRQLPLDYTTPARRREIAARYRQRLAVIEARDGDGAEAITRATGLLIRDHATATFAETRNEPIDARRMAVIS